MSRPEKRLCPAGHDTLLVGRTRWGSCRACRRGDAPISRSILPVRTADFLTMTFDIENRPLSYWIPDRPTAEITAIAWSFDDPALVEVVLLGRDDPRWMLERFLEAYAEADLLTGHYIRRHDLPIINGALLEYGLPTLGPKLTHDTKLDMVEKSDIPATQEYLSEMLDLPIKKVHMTQADWREANRLTPEGLAKTEERVKGDVRQHMLLRPAMIAAGWLKSPRVWRP